MEKTYEVCKYSRHELFRLIRERTQADDFVLNNKPHIAYLDNYLTNIEAQTIVAELTYIDHDYIEDFAEYYVRCFYPYGKTCTRLHFFSCSFEESDFSGLLGGTDSSIDLKTLSDSYLGFIVLKPLTQTIIGRTCLKTYPTSDRPRQFPITRIYDAHLFGIPLTVGTLAFQEQDQVAGACATSALWSAFQGTGKLFQHAIPSPVEITQAASIHTSLESRILPNRGLTLEQMADAIRSVSLEPFVIRSHNEFILKSTVYAYLQGQVPVILKLLLLEADLTLLRPGSHAVVATGYNMGSDITPHPFSGFLLRATRINKLYVHDDQVGPFSRMTFHQSTTRITKQSGEEEETTPLLTHCYRNGVMETLGYVSDSLLVPVYHKIRIPFEKILSIVMVFDQYVELIRDTHSLFQYRLEWDIHLATVSRLKNDVLNNNSLQSVYKVGLLSDSMPRFLWRACAYSGGETVFELLFDATDIEQGNLFVRSIEYNKYACSILRIAFRELGEADLRARPDWMILKWFRENN